MAHITIEMGHVGRLQGALGAAREQEYVSALAPLIASGLHDAGHEVSIIRAVDPAPGGDVFISLHGDGNEDSSIQGASVGYPVHSPALSIGLAQRWKESYEAQGFPFGFLKDNYTVDLARYFRWNLRLGDETAGYSYRFLAEHGHLTNRVVQTWLFEHLSAAARSHVEAVCGMLAEALC